MNDYLIDLLRNDLTCPLPNAIVYHIYSDKLADYLKKKYEFASWRMLALKKTPDKAIKDFGCISRNYLYSEKKIKIK